MESLKENSHAFGQTAPARDRLAYGDTGSHELVDEVRQFFGQAAFTGVSRRPPILRVAALERLYECPSSRLLVQDEDLRDLDRHHFTHGTSEVANRARKRG